MSWASLAMELARLELLLAGLPLTWELEILLPSGERVRVVAGAADQAEVE